MQPPYGLGCNPELSADGETALLQLWMQVAITEPLLLNPKMVELVARQTRTSSARLQCCSE